MKLFSSLLQPFLSCFWIVMWSIIQFAIDFSVCPAHNLHQIWLSHCTASFLLSLKWRDTKFKLHHSNDILWTSIQGLRHEAMKMSYYPPISIFHLQIPAVQLNFDNLTGKVPSQQMVSNQLNPVNVLFSHSMIPIFPALFFSLYDTGGTWTHPESQATEDIE